MPAMSVSEKCSRRLYLNPVCPGSSRGACGISVLYWDAVAFAYPHMNLLRPLPRRLTRTASLVVLVAWVATMAVLVHRSFVEASSLNLATDLARYGTTAEWRGVYYRTEKIGFTVSQTIPA